MHTLAGFLTDKPGTMWGRGVSRERSWGQWIVENDFEHAKDLVDPVQ